MLADFWFWPPGGAKEQIKICIEILWSATRWRKQHMLYIVRTGSTSWFQICMTLGSNSLIWPLLVKKMVRADRFWSFHLVCLEHTTYTHHSNRLDELIPKMCHTWVNSIDLTTFGQKNGQNWPFLVISFSLFGTYYIYASFEPAWRADSKNVWHLGQFHWFDHIWSKKWSELTGFGHFI